MNLADKPCYPFVIDLPREVKYNEGITFREWLIIALSSNPEMIVSEDDSRTIAKNIIFQADAIIKAMEDK